MRKVLTKKEFEKEYEKKWGIQNNEYQAKFEERRVNYPKDDIIIDTINVHKVRMTKINKYKKLNFQGTENKLKGELFAWFIYDDAIMFTIKNREASKFFDIKKLILVYNSETEYWNDHLFITKYSYELHREKSMPLTLYKEAEEYCKEHNLDSFETLMRKKKALDYKPNIKNIKKHIIYRDNIDLEENMLNHFTPLDFNFALNNYY